jgi:hypothetical protein
MLLVDVDIVVTRSLKPLLTLAGEGKTVAFAELEGAIDRQIKYYSSGMQMRLGFGVAAFLEPDVLLVDEVLAVGDASFQQRCLDRMRDVLGAPIFLINPGREIPLGPGSTPIRCSIGVLPLPRGRFYVWVGAYQGSEMGPELFPWQPVGNFDVYGPDLDPAPPAVVRLAPVHVSSEWATD